MTRGDMWAMIMDEEEVMLEELTDISPARVCWRVEDSAVAEAIWCRIPMPLQLSYLRGLR